MDNKTYMVKLAQAGEVVFEAEVVLPGEDKKTGIVIPFGSLRADAKHCEILIEEKEPESEDVKEGDSPISE